MRVDPDGARCKSGSKVRTVVGVHAVLDTRVMVATPATEQGRDPAESLNEAVKTGSGGIVEIASADLGYTGDSSEITNRSRRLSSSCTFWRFRVWRGIGSFLCYVRAHSSLTPGGSCEAVSHNKYIDAVLGAKHFNILSTKWGF